MNQIITMTEFRRHFGKYMKLTENGQIITVRHLKEKFEFDLRPIKAKTPPNSK